MAKKTAAESEEVRLKKKVAAKRAVPAESKVDAALRSLQKRLKREQRKRRLLALRKKNAAGSKAATPAKA
jgi:hypothetical protein